MNLIFLPFLAVIISACAAQDPISSSYTGPTAVVADTYKNLLPDRGDFCILEKVNGERIKNAIIDSLVRSHGQGSTLSAVPTERQVPAKPMKATIKCQTVYAAPILSMLNTVRTVSGKVGFMPEANGEYVVRGDLTSAVATVWIEEYKTRKVVTEVVSESKK